jgi:predicted transcriptional regulator
MAASYFITHTGALNRESSRPNLQLAAPKRIGWVNRFRPDLTARDLMTATVVTARPEDSVARAARLICETDCGALPVVDGSGRLIGIITNSDITTKLIARGVNIAHAQVSDCMTEQAFACPADNSIETCLRAMSWHQIKRIPIVDHDHKVIGIICRRDLARYVCEHAGGSVPLAIADVLWALA